MKFVSDKENISFIESTTINDIVSTIEKKYHNHNKIYRQFCPCCSSIEYNYAFKKATFHYVSCSNCNTLYIQNTLDDKVLQNIKNEIDNKLNESASITKIVEKSSENILYNFDLFLNRTFDITSQKVSIGYIGNKKGLYQEELSKYDNIIMDDFNETLIYDIVIINNSLEKENKPKKMINKVQTSLKSGGYVYITTRVSDGIDILTLWEDSNISPIEHINLLSINGIKDHLLGDFSIKDLSTPGSMDIDFIMNSKSKNLPRFMDYIKNRCDDEILNEFQEFLQKNLLSSYLLVVGKLTK